MHPAQHPSREGLRYCRRHCWGEGGGSGCLGHRGTCQPPQSHSRPATPHRLSSQNDPRAWAVSHSAISAEIALWTHSSPLQGRGVHELQDSKVICSPWAGPGKPSPSRHDTSGWPKIGLASQELTVLLARHLSPQATEAVLGRAIVPGRGTSPAEPEQKVRSPGSPYNHSCANLTLVTRRLRASASS